MRNYPLLHERWLERIPICWFLKVKQCTHTFWKLRKQVLFMANHSKWLINARQVCGQHTQWSQWKDKYCCPLHHLFWCCANGRYLIVKHRLCACRHRNVCRACCVLRCLDVGFPLPRKDMFNGITNDKVRIKCVVCTSVCPSCCLCVMRLV